VAVPVASVDLTLSTGPSRGVDANQQKLLTVRSYSENYTDNLTASGRWKTGMLCFSPLCQLALQHCSRIIWSVVLHHRRATRQCDAPVRGPAGYICRSRSIL